MYGICKPEKNVGSIIGIPRIPKILFKLGRANNSLLFNLTILSESIQSKRRRQRSQEGKNKRENLWDGIPDGRSGQGQGRKNSQHTARVTGATRNSVVLPHCFARLVQEFHRPYPKGHGRESISCGSQWWRNNAENVLQMRYPCSICVLGWT